MTMLVVNEGAHATGSFELDPLCIYFLRIRLSASCGLEMVLTRFAVGSTLENRFPFNIERTFLAKEMLIKDLEVLNEETQLICRIDGRG